jgi:hypothetical protein
MKDSTILHVEDDENDIFLLKLAFDRAGITNPIQVARDGNETINYLAGNGKFSDRSQYPLPCLVVLTSNCHSKWDWTSCSGSASNLRCEN